MAKTVFYFVLAISSIFAPFCAAESIASKNNKGNRLFEKGDYAEAEKAYLSAQGDDPGKPEVLYNLGNTLIRQKKYREGAQVLGQAAQKGNPDLRQKSWYNTGDALFTAGDYRGSVNAFIQALRLNPSDRDAKQNLELALMKLQQQEQQNSGKNQEKEKKDKSAQNKDKSAADPNQNKDQQQQSSNNGKQQPQNQGQNQPSDEVARRREINRDQAMQLLNAVQNQEKEEQRKLLERRAITRANGKDW